MEIFAALSYWHWFGLGLGLIISELLLGTSFFLLWIGASAVATGMIVLIKPNLAWEIQLLVFTGISIAALIYWKLHLQDAKQTTNLNRRNEQYIGRIVTLADPIVNGRGRIHIEDSYWRIEGDDLPAGTSIRIVGVDGVVLKVEKNQ